MDQAVSLLLGAALTWAWYFVRRRVERRRSSEAIERSARLLALKRDLDGAGASIEDLRQLESRLIGKAETAVRIADRYVSQAEVVVRHAAIEPPWQDATHAQALARFQCVDARLGLLLAHMRRELDDDSLADFEHAHAAWLAFRERYARFVARCYCGGALRPLIEAVTLESVTEAWIDELQTQLGDDGARWAHAILPAPAAD